MQTWAIFLDTWRLLLARKLFWATLVVTALVGVGLASFGFTPDGFFLFFALDVKNEFLRAGSPGASMAFFQIYYVLTEWWTTLFGLVLGLISCSSIFTEFMAQGAIDTLVSKPLSRTKLFFAKYASGLLFMAAQVGLLAAIAFLAIRWRLGFWHFPVFWSVPLVLASFSYLYGVAVFFSVWKRSAIISLVMTLLFWGLTAGIHGAASLAAGLAHSPSPDSIMPGATAHSGAAGLIRIADKVGVVLSTVLPKTAATNNLVQTAVMRAEDRETLREKEITDQTRSLQQLGSVFNKTTGSGEELRQQVTADYDDALSRRKSPLFIIGTSLVFEFIVLLLACRMFVRRDC